MSDKAKCKCGQEFYDATCFKNHVSNCMAAKNVSSDFEIWFNLFNSELHLRGDGIQGGTIKDFMEIAWNAQQSRIASLEEREKILKHEKETLGNDLDEAFDLVCKSDFINQRELLNILERNDNLYGLE